MSESAFHPVSGKAEDYPEGWSKKDEEAEKEYLATGMINWKEMTSWKFWIRKEWWCEHTHAHPSMLGSSLIEDLHLVYYLIFAAIAILVILMTLFHDQVSRFLLT